MRELKRIHEEEEGAALVEFVLVFPVQLMLTLVIIQLALVLYAHVVVYQAACLGARAAAVSDLMGDVNGAQEAATRMVARQVAVLTPNGSNVTLTGGATPPANSSLRWTGAGGMSALREQEAYALLRNAPNVRRNAAAGGTALFSCEVEFDYVMTIPVGGQALASFNASITSASNRRGGYAVFPVRRAGFFVAPWLAAPQ